MSWTDIETILEQHRCNYITDSSPKPDAMEKFSNTILTQMQNLQYFDLFKNGQISVYSESYYTLNVPEASTDINYQKNKKSRARVQWILQYKNYIEQYLSSMLSNRYYFEVYAASSRQIYPIYTQVNHIVTIYLKPKPQLVYF